VALPWTPACLVWAAKSRTNISRLVKTPISTATGFLNLGQVALMHQWAHRLCWTIMTLKANSHVACRAHAVPLPCHAVNSHMPCHAMPLPCSDSAVSFVKVHVVAGNIRTGSPTV
jgi:hypothetical protein